MDGPDVKPIRLGLDQSAKSLGKGTHCKKEREKERRRNAMLQTQKGKITGRKKKNRRETQKQNKTDGRVP